MAAPAATAPATVLLPALQGHALRGSLPPSVGPDLIERFPALVARALLASRATRREHGFLAYAPADAALPLVAEPMAEGHEEGIAWHWEHPHATVAFSFHTHPGDDALCEPSGIDVVGALIRGDHLLYVLTDDGRLAGWRFRDPAGHPGAVMDAMLALVDAGRLDKRFVAFLYDAAGAMHADLLERVYAARVELLPEGCRFRRARVPRVPRAARHPA